MLCRDRQPSELCGVSGSGWNTLPVAPGVEAKQVVQPGDLSRTWL